MNTNINGNSYGDPDGDTDKLWEDAERQIRQAAAAGGSTTVSVKSSKPTTKRKLDEGKDKHAEQKKQKQKKIKISGREGKVGKEKKKKQNIAESS